MGVNSQLPFITSVITTNINCRIWRRPSRGRNMGGGLKSSVPNLLQYV